MHDYSLAQACLTMQEILSVTELNNHIKKQLETGFSSVSVKGEISNLKTQASGHLYFTLKDEHSQISAVLFRGSAQGMSRVPKNGDQVILQGQMNVYSPRGTYQIVVRKLEYAGIGELLLKLHELKNKLAGQGWFDPKCKKAIPKYPKKIGIVTSATGSVIQDIIHVLSRRSPHTALLLNPVKVQGEGAALEIARAIDDFNHFQLADVLIVGRGGGSLEDLWAFNEEYVASAIFRSKIPIVSAVGHETDYSIADFVSDLRAPTPSAAAEIVSIDVKQQWEFLQTTQMRLLGHLKTQIQQHKKQFASLNRHPFLSSPYAILAPHIQKIDDTKEEIINAIKRSVEEKKLKIEALQKRNEVLKPSAKIAILKEKFSHIQHALQSGLSQLYQTRKQVFHPVLFYKKIDLQILRMLQVNKEKLAQLISHLKGIDPKNLLTKGFCILFNEKKDSVILSTQSLQPKDRVHLQLHDGELKLTVESLNKELI
jgi:exodeoxyribonuclease VII large subunit